MEQEEKEGDEGARLNKIIKERGNEGKEKETK